MKTFAVRRLVLLVAVPFLLDCSVAQQKGLPKKKELISPLVPTPSTQERDSSLRQPGSAKEVLAEIEGIIQRGEGEGLSRYLSPQVYISLKGSEWGFYSSNQATYVLWKFFSTYKPISFSFSTYGEVESNPFATGRGYFSSKGVRESLQIYVSLAYREGRWLLVEFNAY